VAKLKQFQEETVNKVLAQVKEFQEVGALDLPTDYSPANALKAAWFALLNQKGNVLETCTNTSIVNALMEMVTQGLNPAKKQCAFIAYGNQLAMQREYFGTIALAKRYHPEIENVTANVIFKKDVFRYKIDPITGRKQVSEHSQELENIDLDNIRGAYATIIFSDGHTEMEPMTMPQIRKAWNQGPMNGNSPAHKNFPDQMSIKTVINRILKPYINASDDSEIISTSRQTIPKNANSETIDLTDGEVTELTNVPEEKPEQNKEPEPKKPDLLKVKDLTEAKEFLADNLGVSPDAITEKNYQDVAKAHGFVIEFVPPVKEDNPGY
jgi:recombination protein RecT